MEQNPYSFALSADSTIFAQIWITQNEKVIRTTLKIGIGGVSQSGKSTLASILRHRLSQIGRSVVSLDQDQFVLPEDQLPSVRNRHDWEVPESMDWTKMLTSYQGHLPAYDVVIVEGILAFNNEELNQTYDKRIYLEVSKETFKARRSEDMRWGREPAWYYDHVWDSHFIHGLTDSQKITLNMDAPYDLDALIEDLIS